MASLAIEAGLFAALGDPTRLSLLQTLSREGPRSIAALTGHAGMTRQAVTKHLRVLERVGLVRSDRAGRESRFVCEPQKLGAARAYLDAVSAQWDEALVRLQLHLEEK
ncbi:MAG TPA: metalloregulator ArsR/SmtB family transcription factor [Allosphingosinicella sp.]|nr:metalloregulator ArsR/SmtB family transcription factor [Allosphingosinicella sp.]